MIEAIYPRIRESVRQQRLFLKRAVQCLAAQGIRQYLDIGAGFPAEENTHEVAQAATPGARVVYVDNDQVVLAHAQALLSGGPGQTAYLDADLRDTETILAEAPRLLDFSAPIAVLLLGILQLIPDGDNPAGIVQRLVEAVPSGSYLVIVQPAADVLTDVVARGVAGFNDRSPIQLRARTHDEVTAFFAGTSLLEPGVVQVNQWRPEDPASDIAREPMPIYGGVGCKP